MNKRVSGIMQKKAAHKNNQYEGISDSALLETLSAFGIPYASAGNVAVYPLGSLMGLVQNINEGDDENKLREKLNDYSAATFLPGVLGYRDMLRDRLADRKVSKGKVDRKALVSEMLGTGSSTLLSALALGLLGGGAGYVLGDSGSLGSRLGAGLGAGLGAAGGLSAALVGLLLGMYKRRRSAEEHGKYLTDPNLIAKNLLIPGYSAYQTGRRMRSRTAASLDA